MKQTYLFLCVLITCFASCSKRNSAEQNNVHCSSQVEVDCVRDIPPPGIIENTAEIEGYTDKQSYTPGDSIHFYTHCLSDSFRIELKRYGAFVETKYISPNIKGLRQNYDPYSYSWGCEWERTHSFKVPQNFNSGIYSANLIDQNGASSYVTFVIKPKLSETPKLLVLASTNTWQAYNKWSGSSFYLHDLNDDIPYSNIVSFHRPNIVDRPTGNNGHLVNGELHLLRWLENQGIEYGMIADMDMHLSRDYIDKATTLVLNTHSEYWTSCMYDNLGYFLNQGKNLAYLSANGVYWRSAIGCNRIEVKKEDEQHTYDIGYGGRWSDIGRSEAGILGVSYDRRGYDTYAPYKVINPEHWIFEGTNLVEGELIGANGLNKGGASGWETDKMTIHSPKNIVHLAKGTNPDNGGADMIYYENEFGGKVFSVGSITYTGSLSVDENISQITRNVFDEFLNE